MTSTYAHAYVHNHSVGDFAACKSYIEQTGPIVGRFYEHDQIEGYQLLLIEDKDYAEDELVLTMWVEPLTEGRFPYVYIRIQPADNSQIDIDEAMNQLGCVRIDQELR